MPLPRQCYGLLVRATLFAPVLAVAALLFCRGYWVQLFERDFHSDFRYPLHVDNLEALVEQLRSGRWPPSVAPINAPDVGLLVANADRCPADRAVHLLLVIKSAVHNAEQRAAVRATWAAERHRFGTRHVFLLGRGPTPRDDASVRQEHELHGDIVQGNFADTYGNVTTKTLMGLGWTLRHCPGAGHVFFADDDYWVSVANLRRSLRRRGVSLLAPAARSHLYLGRVFRTAPIRACWSKWYISLREYPYHRFPPFVNAGAFLLSAWTLQTLYYAAYFTQPLRFDDVYLAILAHKMRIPLTDDAGFFNDRPPHPDDAYAGHTAVHGFAPSELRRVWDEQRRLRGNW